MKYTIWLTGLPCSGKTTIGNLLKNYLNAKGCKTIHFDGDVLRKNLCSDLGFSKTDRIENIRRVSCISELLNTNDIVVINSFVSPNEEIREIYKKIISDVKTIYTSCPLETCIERDVKGMYEKAIKGEIPNFTGISSPFDPPIDPELTVFTNSKSPQESLEEIIRELDI